jgi:hypothetical protein
MALVGSILTRVVGIKKSMPELRLVRNGIKIQKNQLLKLLRKARGTEFGRHYKFDDIFFSKDPTEAFRNQVPLHDYNKMHQDWWHRCLNNEDDVCWPGKVKYFALSSGTSESASKHIPLTAEMIRSIKRTSVRQILSLSKYELPEGLLNRGFLMVGGSTHLVHMGDYYEGDLSGITASKIPSWFQYFYKPGKQIAKERDWATKIDMIVESAPTWDIGIIVGVPAWIQIILEKVIERYNLKTIHDMWPNLHIFVHGGVSFTPYKKGFERLMAKPLIYIENYLASEGFIAYVNRPGSTGMRLVLNNGIYYEFVPFNPDNFDSEGNIMPDAKALTLAEVEEGKEYALLLTTNAGAWRYLIGDTVKFTSKEHFELVITGRTKHFLSLVGEHLSVDNMNAAIAHVAEQLNVEIPEYTVAGVEYERLFAHQWFVGVQGALPDATKVRNLIDEQLSRINDDYAVERKSALKEVLVEVLPAEVFLDYLRSKGKEGGQNKFPRVIRNSQLQEWKSFIQQPS